MTPEQWARVFRAAGRAVDGHPNPNAHLSVALWVAATECELIAAERAAEARTEQDEADTDDAGAPRGTSYSRCAACNAEIMRYPDTATWLHGNAALDALHLAWKTPGNLSWFKQPPRL